MSDFKPGDVVVRIRNPRDPFPHFSHLRQRSDPNFPAPPHGKPVLVTGVMEQRREVGLIIQGYPSSHASRAWSYAMFRHLPRATEEFTAQMRACKPIREQVPA